MGDWSIYCVQRTFITLVKHSGITAPKSLSLKLIDFITLNGIKYDLRSTPKSVYLDKPLESINCSKSWCYRNKLAIDTTNLYWHKTPELAIEFEEKQAAKEERAKRYPKRPKEPSLTKWKSVQGFDQL